MKTKISILVLVCAILTLSFTFVSVNNSSKKEIKQVSAKETKHEPLGGFVSADKF